MRSGQFCRISLAFYCVFALVEKMQAKKTTPVITSHHPAK